MAVTTRPALAGGVFRAVLAGVMAAVAPIFYPAIGPFTFLAWGYALWTAVLLLLIRGNSVPELRVPIGGIVDYLAVTIIVHELGSVRSTMVLLYFIAGTLYALAAPFSTAVGLASFGSALYAGTVAAERLGFLAFAPASPQVAAIGQPDIGVTLFGIGVGAGAHVGLVWVVATLVRQLRIRGEELAQANERLRELSDSDPLTGLYNRRFLLSQLELQLARVRRGAIVSVLMIDLDRFKRLNDTQGHLRGDLLLQRISQLLRGALRVTDVAARVGGDEIVALLPDTGSLDARVVAERIVASVKKAGIEFDPVCPVSASVGHAQARPDDDPPTLLSRADDNTYAAKRAGGDGVAMESDAPRVSTEPKPMAGTG